VTRTIAELIRAAEAAGGRLVSTPVKSLRFVTRGPADPALSRRVDGRRNDVAALAADDGRPLMRSEMPRLAMRWLNRGIRPGVDAGCHGKSGRRTNREHPPPLKRDHSCDEYLPTC